MSSNDRKWSEGMSRHLRRGKFDQAAYHAVHGDPDLMLQYFKGKQGSEIVSESNPPLDQMKRDVQVNGVPLSDDAWNVIRHLESISGEMLPDGAYWYDSVCGAFGVWGYGTLLFFPPNLPLGGPMIPYCSGPPTGVFINGRDIHPSDLQQLAPFVGQIMPGVYFLDAQGNMGVEGQPPMTNLRMLMGL